MRKSYRCGWAESRRLTCIIFFLSGDLPYLNHQLIVVCHILVTPTKQVICFALSAHIPRFIRLGQFFTGHDLLIPDTQGMEYLPTTRHAFFVVVFHILPSPLLIVQAHCAFCALRLPALVIAARVSGLCVPAEKQTCKHSPFLLLHHAHFFVETVYDAAIVCGDACLRELGGWNILWHPW